MQLPVQDPTLRLKMSLDAFLAETASLIAFVKPGVIDFGKQCFPQLIVLINSVDRSGRDDRVCREPRVTPRLFLPGHTSELPRRYPNFAKMIAENEVASLVLTIYRKLFS
jgi:hypothetical protein